MNKLSLIALLFVALFVNNATAATKDDGVQYKTKWDIGNIDSYKCKGTATDYGWSTSETGTDRKWQKYLTKHFVSNDGVGYGAVYYIAHEMKEHGYKFCKTTLGSIRTGCGYDSHTTYYKNGNDCFWLCEPGYFGENCSSKTISVNKHDFKKEGTRKAFATGKVQSIDVWRDKNLSNIEEKVPMFIKNQYHSCNGGIQAAMRKMNKKQEHDVVLAIKKIEVNEKSGTVKYTVQPLVVRAAGTQGCLSLAAGNTAWPFTQFVASYSTSLCPSDMMHKDKEFTKNNSNAGCFVATTESVAADKVSQEEQTAYAAAVNKAQSLEKQGLAILCQGWDSSKYDNKIHELKAAEFSYSNWRKMPADYDGGNTDKSWTYGDATATCTVFVCKDGKGFASDPTISGNYGCIDCAKTDSSANPLRLGRGSDGVCTVCPVGEIVDDGNCVKATAIHKFYMGGETKNTNGSATAVDDLTQQCWTIPTPDGYRSCLNAGGWATDINSSK